MPKRFALCILLSSSMCIAQTSYQDAGSDNAGYSNSSSQSTSQSYAGISAQSTQQGNDLNSQDGLRNSTTENATTENNQGRNAKLGQTIQFRPIIRSDFEKFVADAAGSYLPVYGRELFSGPPSTFAPLDRIPVPSTYVIGPGDELQVRIWGMVNFQGALTVDRNGQISIPKVGVINVGGVQYAQLEQFLRSAVSRIFKGFELNATMGRLRSIQIYVLGNAIKPGMFTVGSLSTLVDALFVSGGPSSTGSMRNIQLRRGNQLVTNFDIYDLQHKGDRTNDVPLQPGDVIFIPPISKQVALLGNVNQPGIYELKDKTTVGEILQIAGGLSSVATTELAILERIENRSRRLVDQFSLSGAVLQRPMQDGDLLRIFPVSPKIEQVVTLRGNVADPGRFAWHEGMRVSDLIPTRDALISRAHWRVQNLQANTNRNLTTNGTGYPVISDNLSRTTPDGHPLPPTDSATAGTTSNGVATMGTSATTTATGGQQTQSETQSQKSANSDLLSNDVSRVQSLLDPNSAQSVGNRKAQAERKRLEELAYQDLNSIRIDEMASIDLNSTEINWEYALIERVDEKDLSTRLFPFNLGRALDAPDSAENPLLRSGDIVTIFSRQDMALPMEKYAAIVRISGEVNAPGVYRIAPGESLRDVIAKAGGLAKNSFVYGTVLNRLSAKKAQKQQLDQSIALMKRDFSARLSNAQSSLSSSSQSKDALNSQYAMQQNMLDQLAAVQPTGRVVLGMKPSAHTVEDLPDFALEDGDTVIIPPRLNTVQIVGEVYNANAFRFDGRKSVEQYLKVAGGTTRNADKSHIYVLRADGTTIPREQSLLGNKFGNKHLAPGDAIIVPMRIRVPSIFWQNLAPIMSTLSQTATTGVIVGNYM